LKANLITNEEQIEVFPYFERAGSIFKSLGLGYSASDALTRSMYCKYKVT